MVQKISLIFALALNAQRIEHAQMAELVDALVSNTSGAIRAGSIPALGTTKIANCLLVRQLANFAFKFVPKLCPHIPTLFYALRSESAISQHL